MQIDADVSESKGLLNYMQRCCLCFLCACCCDCDPSVNEDRNRKKRVKQYVLSNSNLLDLDVVNCHPGASSVPKHNQPADADATGTVQTSRAYLITTGKLPMVFQLTKMDTPWTSKNRCASAVHMSDAMLLAAFS